MKTTHALISICALAGAMAAPRAARAQDSGLHQLQTGALITYAEAEVKLLYAAFNARQFDLELTERMMGEVARTLDDAKRSLDRTNDLLDEKSAKVKPDIAAARKLLVRAEGQLTSLKKETEAQVKPYLKKLEAEDEEEGAEGEEAAEPDWNLLKDHIGWIYEDVSSAQKAIGKLSKSIKTPALKAPPKPKGKRG